MHVSKHLQSFTMKPKSKPVECGRCWGWPLGNGKSWAWVSCCDGVRSDKWECYQKVVNCHLDCFAHSSSCQFQLPQKCNLISNAFPLFFSTAAWFSMALYVKRLLWAAVALKHMCCLLMNKLWGRAFPLTRCLSRRKKKSTRKGTGCLLANGRLSGASGCFLVVGLITRTHLRAHRGKGGHYARELLVCTRASFPVFVLMQHLYLF